MNMNATSYNKRVSGSAPFGCSDPNLPFGQTSDTRKPLAHNKKAIHLNRL